MIAMAASIVCASGMASADRPHGAHRHERRSVDAPSALSGTTRPIAGWVRAHGRALADRDGDIVLRGVNASGMEYGTGAPGGMLGGKWQPGYQSFPDDMYDNIRQWGFNFIRVPISWANLEPTAPVTGANGNKQHAYNETYMAAVDRIVANAKRDHLAVILSMHQWGWSPAFQQPKATGVVIHGCGMPAWLYEGANIDAYAARQRFFTNSDRIWDDYAAAWRFVANRYAGESTVIGADMFNEPNLDPTYGKQPFTGASVAIDGLYRTVGAAVRSVNPRILLIFQTSRTTTVDAAPRFDNVVFSLHSYPKRWAPEVVNWIDPHMKLCEKWNVPFWIGEFQTIGKPTDESGPDSWRFQTSAMLLYCKQHNLNWSYWAYQRAARPLSTTDKGAPIDMDTVHMLQTGL